MAPVHVLQLVLLLLAVAILLALAARRLHIPPAAAFVSGGMLLAVSQGIPGVALDPDLAMVLFLPPLLQSSAFFTVWRDFRANLRPILLLAVGAVLFTTLAVGWVLKLLVPELPWAACFAFGAIVSPPDAVSAAAVLERLRIPRRLLTVLEGESLVNDASGLVLYRFAVAATLTGSFNVAEAGATFAYVAAAGIAIGCACGWASVRLIRGLHDTRLEIAVSFLVAWASYIAAEAAHASGVLSVVAGGLVMGWQQHAAFTSRTRTEARATWGFVTFALEALVFILIGLSLRGVLDRLGETAIALLPLGAALAATVIAVRFAWVLPATYLPRALLPRLRARDPHPHISVPVVVSWAGMRGVVSLAAALALPTDFPGRDLILFLTFCVILVTVLLQGTTLGPLIQWLGVARADDAEAASPGTASPETAARARIARAALARVEERAGDPLDGAIARDLLAEFRDRAGMAARTHEGGGAAAAEHSARLSVRLDALAAARGALLAMHRAGDVHEAQVNALEQELDLQEIRLRGQLDGWG